MTIAFERPVGSAADVKELEYVSALTQTSMPDLRTNGSIYVEDILVYLMSRHGIKASEEVVQKDIMTDLAGDLSSDPSQVIDICQIASILLLPHYKKVADSGDDERIQKLFGKGLDLVLAELPPDERWFPDGYKPGAKPILSVELLQEILAFQGEYQVPPQILEDMVRAAGGEGQVLDVPTLTRAMTDDLAAYQVNREAVASTHYEDATHEEQLEKVHGDVEENDDPVKEQEEANHGVSSLKRGFTASNIDLTAETYGNKFWVALTWFAAILLFFAFLLRQIRSFGHPKCTVLTDFSCKLVTGIVQWLIIFVQLSVLGLAFICLSNMGNSVFNRFSFFSIGGIIVGMTTVFITTIVSFFVAVRTKYFATKHYPGFEIQNYTILIIGITLVCFQILELFRILVPANIIRSIPFWKFFIRPTTVKLERATKHAAANKTEKMVNNALSIHNSCSQPGNASLSSSTMMGSVLLAYQVTEHDAEPCGGILWAWKKMYDGSIYHEEGVWLHARLIASNIGHLFVVATIILGWVFIYFKFINAPAEKTTSPTIAPSTLVPSASPSTKHPTIAPYTSYPSAFQSQLTSHPTALYTQAAADDSSTHVEINAAVSTGAIFAILACFSVGALYIPSAISTVLKFRSGVLPSLRSKEFLQYRFAADQTTSLLGSSFWGALYASAVCWALAGIVVFVLISKTTRQFIIIGFAQVSGIIVTLIAKIVVLIILRQRFYAAFYRKNPGGANIMSTVLECWNVGLSTLYMMIRSVILIIITAIYIARIDTPLLAPGVGHIGPIILDAGPFAFRKDILVHDAHRHPYIERLGLLYMMKLRYGEAFASRAGSCWRLLFTMALMPWLRKYRIRSLVESLDDNVAENGQKGETNRALAIAMMAASEENNENASLELEVKVLRDRVRELEEEISRINSLSFKNEPVMSDHDASINDLSFRNEPVVSKHDE